MGPPFDGRAADGLLQERDLLVASDQRSLDPQGRSTPAAARLDGDSSPGGNRHALALEWHRRQFLVLDDVARDGVGAAADDDFARLSGLLEPRGGVDRIAGHHPVAVDLDPPEVDEDLAGFDANAQGEFRPAFVPQLGGQLEHGGLHLEGGANGTLRVVLVDDRDAEDREHRVAGELFDRALVARRLGGQPLERPRDDRLHELRVGRLVEGCEADQVGEQDAGDLALGGCRPWNGGAVSLSGCAGVGDRRAAARTEPGTRLQGRSAGRARRLRRRPAVLTEARARVEGCPAGSADHPRIVATGVNERSRPARLRLNGAAPSIWGSAGARRSNLS